MHRCHVPEVDGDTVVVEGDEAHHILRVLRLGIGAPVAVFDGRGHEWTGTISVAGHRTVTIGPLAPRQPVPEPAVAITLAVGVLKGEQMSHVVRDAVMLGAAAIVPIVSAHTARPAQPGAVSARWSRVALASARQCRRAVVPPVRPVTSFDAAIAEPYDVRIIGVEPAAPGGATAHPPRPPGTALLLIGPEGGWSPAEVERAKVAGAYRLDLGPRTIRAESAPAVALASLWAGWGWI